ncbi:ABC transporter substrate-binding protein [Cohnella cellulosilytica]|uniref:ABC transporter substrate-binding protein n=1 Tax=Cohnella cellulosilytica TaxID=986710 RepID=A0ABW2F8B9_9BACL
MKMKKAYLPIMLGFVLIAGACSGGKPGQSTNAASSASQASGGGSGGERKPGIVTYESENGPVEVPADPQRIVGLTNAPNIASLDGRLVGVDEWTKSNPLFAAKLADVEVVSDADLTRISELHPDLIVAGAWMNHLDEMSEIAPTIIFTWGMDYLDQQLEIGKLLGQEAQTQAWIDDFKSRAKAAGDRIKAKHGDDVTVSVFEYDSNDIYVFGNNWAHGTEILYQAMGLKMPDRVEQDTAEAGYYTLVQNEIPDYAGDFVVLSKNKDGNDAFLESAAWKNLPAVTGGRVMEIDSASTASSDPTTLEYLLDIFKEGFLTEP